MRPPPWRLVVFDATALRPESGLRSTPRGELWRGTASDRATVPARVGRVSDPRRRPPLGSGGSSRYCQSGRARGTLGHARSSAWHASVLSCLLPRMTPGAAPPANRRSYARRRSGTRDLQYCLAGCLPEPSKLCAHVGEPARPFPACVMLLYVLSTNRDRRARP